MGGTGGRTGTGVRGDGAGLLVLRKEPSRDKADEGRLSLNCATANGLGFSPCEKVEVTVGCLSRDAAEEGREGILPLGTLISDSGMPSVTWKTSSGSV